MARDRPRPGGWQQRPGQGIARLGIDAHATQPGPEQSGDHGHAAATLERAISIEPNNAWLWHHLAAARLREGRLDQAASLAAKSNSLAGTDSGLQVNNWKLIAAVRRHQGDGAGAAAAESRAAALLQ